MTITFRPAKREGVSLLIGLAGPSGGGKTLSAMKLAAGLAGGNRFAVIDTEAGRALHYADDFQFDHADLRAPFTPDAYADAIQAADKAGYQVVLVDSMSHEWEGDGGILDWQEAEFARMGSRDSVKMLSWQAPKKSHRKMLTRLLQVRAHVILCFRAQDRIEMAKVDGRTVVRPKQTLTGLDGWVPICEPRLPYELTLSALVLPDAPGVPRPIKLQEQHKPFFPLDRPIEVTSGVLLAQWAAGGASEALVSDADRKLIGAAAKSAGVSTDRLREIVQSVAGVSESARIPASKVDAILTAIDATKQPDEADAIPFGDAA